MSRHTKIKMLLQNNIQSKIQKFLGFGKVVLMLEQSPFWINNTKWWTKCTLKRQKVSSWHHFFKEGKITVSPQLTSKNRNSISKALSSLKFPCSFGITLLGHFSAPLSFQLLLLFPIYIVIGLKRAFTVFCTLTWWIKVLTFSDCWNLYHQLFNASKSKKHYNEAN